MTEYYAVIESQQNPAEYGIELLNLKGAIATNKNNITLTIGDLLLEDVAQKRFSIISFDTDVPDNRKAFQRQVKAGRVVGSIAAHTPDFEFANFAIQELVEIAARIDDTHNYSGDVTRGADWNGVTNARAFENRYKEVSDRKPQSLKGEEWGRALAKYAYEHPNRSDTGVQRDFIHQITLALRTRFARYADHKKRYKIDPNTFKLVESI
jgi:hypothetical protein